MLRKKIASFVFAAVFTVAALPIAQVQAAELKLEKAEVGHSIYYADLTISGNGDVLLVPENSHNAGEVSLADTDKLFKVLREELNLISADNVLSVEWLGEVTDEFGRTTSDRYNVKKADGTGIRYSLRDGGNLDKGYLYQLHTSHSFPGPTVDLYLYTEDYKTAQILPFNGIGDVREKDGVYFGYRSTGPLYVSYNLKDWHRTESSYAIGTNADETNSYIYPVISGGYANCYEYVGNQTWKEVLLYTGSLISLESIKNKPKERITSLKLVSSIGAATTGEAITPAAATGQTTDTPSKSAAPIASTVLINGEATSFEAYNIDGNNFFKLRDLAMVLSGTEKQFDVSWDGVANAMVLLSNSAYTVAGGELAKGDGTTKNAQLTTSKIMLNGKEIQLTAYNIGGNNYFKLRDIGKTFDFATDWDGANNAIMIDTSKPYTE